MFRVHTPIIRSVRASAHEQFFAAAVNYFLAVHMDSERNTCFAHDLAQSVCRLHEHEAFALSQHVWPYSSRSLDVARRKYNYRLTRARWILLCAFGIVRNKWRIFHCTIDVRPDFCNVTVETRFILHNFIHQRDGFQFQGTLRMSPQVY